MSIRYSPVQQTLHWVTVLLMIAILPVAWVVVSVKEDTAPFYFFLDIHKVLGLAILALTLVRIAWRLIEPSPRHPRGMPGWNVALATTVMLGLLLAMIVMPVTGYVWTTGHGYDVEPFGLVRFPRLFWKERALGDLAKTMHQTGQWFVYGLISLHLVGVSYHLIVRRDGLLGRMLPPQALDAG